MKKLFITLLILFWAGSCFAATYYVDKRCADNGDGTASSCASGDGNPGAFSLIWYVLEQANVPNGTHTIEIIANSGPYTPEDFRNSSDVGYSGRKNFAPEQTTPSEITYNFNDNIMRCNWNVNDPTYYRWVASTANAGEYYLTSVAGTKPKLPWAPAVDFTEVTTCTINGVWNDATMNLSNNTSYKIHNWDWGDDDTIGFDTLYVKLSNGSDPTNSGYDIWVNELLDQCWSTFATRGLFIVNDCEMWGGGDISVYVNSNTIGSQFYRCKFKWMENSCISVGNAGSEGIVVANCVFIDSGHRAFRNIIGATNVQFYNNTVTGAHLGILSTGVAAWTLSVKNNIFDMMYAGGMQIDNANVTLTESNNSFYLDPDSTHSGKSIAFTSATRQWTTTDSTDSPASTATTDTTGVDSSLLPTYKINTDSTAYQTGTFITGFHDTIYGDQDYFGNPMFSPYSMGAHQGNVKSGLGGIFR